MIQLTVLCVVGLGRIELAALEASEPHSDVA
jgi:hypothetical protein